MSELGRGNVFYCDKIYYQKIILALLQMGGGGGGVKDVKRWLATYYHFRKLSPIFVIKIFKFFRYHGF